MRSSDYLQEKFWKWLEHTSILGEERRKGKAWVKSLERVIICLQLYFIHQQRRKSFRYILSLKRLSSMTNVCQSLVQCSCWQIANLMETNQRISVKVRHTAPFHWFFRLGRDLPMNRSVNFHSDVCTLFSIYVDSSQRVRANHIGSLLKAYSEKLRSFVYRNNEEQKG